MSIIPMLWIMSAGATFVAICVTFHLICKQPGDELPFSVAGFEFDSRATSTSDSRRSAAPGEAPVVYEGVVVSAAKDTA